MIDINVKVVGEAEMAQRFARAELGVRDVLREELAAVGEEIVTRAQANAPKATGLMAAKVIWGFGQWRKRGRGDQRKTQLVETKNERTKKIVLTVMPTGRVAHLVERGVNASFTQRTGRGKNDIRTRSSEVTQRPYNAPRQGPEYRYSRTLSIAPRPFFMPAVESVGGATGVNDRLQGALDQLAGAT